MAGSGLRILLPALYTATMPGITETLHMNTIFSRRSANGQRLHWTFSKGDENKSVKPFPTLLHHHKVASSVSGRTYSLSIHIIHGHLLICIVRIFPRVQCSHHGCMHGNRCPHNFPRAPRVTRSIDCALRNSPQEAQTYYNYIRLHQGIGGMVPAQMANIPMDLTGNRWMTMIGLATESK